jgi:hypothetical protein
MRRERSLRRRTRYSSASLPFDVPATAACNRPDGRGRGAAIDVRRNAVADRLLACAANRRMRRLGQMQQTTPEVRPDAGRATHFSTSARSTGGFERLPGTRPAICRCSRRPKGRSSPRNDLESGECRLTLLGCDSVIVVGTTTSRCVRATVVDAFSLNYRVILAQEGCCDRSEAPFGVNQIVEKSLPTWTCSASDCGREEHPRSLTETSLIFQRHSRVQGTCSNPSHGRSLRQNPRSLRDG